MNEIPNRYNYIDIDGKQYVEINPEYEKYVMNKNYTRELKKSGIPDYYWNIDFDDYIGDKNSTEYRDIVRYANYCDSPEYNHVHLFLYGKNSTQKCITGDSYILTDNGFEQIKDYKQSTDGFTKKEINLQTKEGLKTTRYFFQEDTHALKNIELENGMEITGTLTHPLYTINKNNNLEYKQLKDLTIDDYIIIDKGSNIFSKIDKEFDFIFKASNRDYCHKKVILPLCTDDKLARFLGYFIANGSFSHNNINISTSTLNVKIRKDIIDILKSYNLTIGKLQNNTDFRICSVVFTNFIKYLLGSKNKLTARYKCVPKSILQGTKNIQINFLKALFDCDSYYDKTKNCFKYFTASKTLVKEIQLMLLNFNIHSYQVKTYKEEYNHTYYELLLNNNDTLKYFTLITNNSFKYKESLKKRKDVSYYYRIPNLLKETKEKLKILKSILKVDKSGRFNWEGKRTRFKLGKIINYGGVELTFSFKKVVVDLLENFQMYDQNDIIKNLRIKYNNIKENFLFIKIKCIKDIYEKTKVYDVTVPNTHNFYANGIVNHNTALSCNILKEGIKKGLKCKFMLSNHLIKLLLKVSGFNVEKEWWKQLEELQSMDLIVIDDCFDPKKTLTWKNSDIIISEWDSFFRDLLPSKTKIIVTSNFNLNIVQQYYSKSMSELIERNFVLLELKTSVKEIRKDEVTKNIETKQKSVSSDLTSEEILEGYKTEEVEITNKLYGEKI